MTLALPISPVRTSADDIARSHAVRRAAFASSTRFLSDIDRLDALWAAAISLDDNAGYLLPVCTVHARDQTIAPAPDVTGAPALRLMVVDATGGVVSQIAVAMTGDEGDVACIDITREPAAGASFDLTVQALRTLVRWIDDHFQTESTIAGSSRGLSCGW